MAIYRSLIEDSINDLDTNNDGYKETKELMDQIEGNDINRQEIDDAQDADFGPDDIDDIMDEACMAIAESQAVYYETMQALALDELMEAARGNVRGEVSEEFDKQTKKKANSALKNKFASLLSRILSSIRKFINKLNDIVKRDKAFIAKNEAKIVAGAKAIGVVSIKGYSYAGLDPTIKKLSKDNVTSSKIYKAATSGRGMSQSDVTADFNRIVNGMAGADVDGSIKAYNQALKNTIRGSAEPVEVQISAADAIKILKDYNNSVAVAKKMADEAKVECKSAMMCIDKVDARGRGGSARGAEGGDGNLHKALSYYINFLTLARSAVLDGLHGQKNQARKAANMYARAAKSADARGREGRAVRGESAIEDSFKYGYLSNLNLI